MSAVISIQDVLGEGGILSRRLQGFRERPQQLEMANAIAAAVNEERHLVVEAPTGVGKSLAYLVPLLLGAVDQGRKVVIVTHTIALQDQLFDKDIPLLASCLPVEFTVTKAMGRSNYLGIRRFGLAQERAPTLVADDPTVRSLQRVADWVPQAFEGRRQELQPPVRGELWEQIQSESDNCLGHRCDHFNDCFYQSARRRAQSANIVITNHALYAIDIMLRKQDAALLPEHDVLVVDEAHHLERVAQEHFGVEISRQGMRRFLRRLVGGRGSRGLLPSLEGQDANTVEAMATSLAAASDRFFDEVDSWCASQPQSNGRYREPALWDDVLSSDLDQLGQRLESLASNQEREDLRLEAEAFSFRAGALASGVRALLSVDDEDLVYFVEREPRRRQVTMAARPLDIGPILETDLFDRMGSAILTSATLSAGRDAKGLEYFVKRHGITGADQKVIGSPFDLSRLMEVHVPGDLPLPDDTGFDEAAAGVILSQVDRLGGGAFILCTSYRSLEALWRLLAGPLRERGLLALKQGDSLDRATMLERFREDGNAVLFGAESFWHGVDVPGPALRLVVITRLPFPVPAHPMNEARSERLRRQGENPFTRFFLPEAVIRFRQGCGRLVRQEDDEGLVLCLDRRVIERPYGGKFRASLGDAPWVTDAPSASQSGADG